MAGILEVLPTGILANLIRSAKNKELFKDNPYIRTDPTAFGSWKPDSQTDRENDSLLKALEQEIQGIGNEDVSAYWNSLSESDKLAKLNNYWYQVDGFGDWAAGKQSKFNLDAFKDDLNDLSRISNIPLPDDVYTPNAEGIVEASPEAIQNKANAEADADIQTLLDSLAQDRAMLNESYQSDLNNIRSDYGNLRDSTLALQAQQNNAMMDTLSSQMSKARQNALEAGASAGSRLAENINLTLSTQNRMAQQSLQTSNNLAQMLINQRAAEQSARNNWQNANLGLNAQARDYTASKNARVADRVGYWSDFYNAKQNFSQNQYDNAFEKGTSEENNLIPSYKKYKNTTGGY